MNIFISNERYETEVYASDRPKHVGDIARGIVFSYTCALNNRIVIYSILIHSSDVNVLNALLSRIGSKLLTFEVS